MHLTVGVLRGGPSREHEVSLKSGAAILAHLPEDKYEARDIYINKGGVWHDRGRPTTPDRVLRQLDVALLGLHGEYGEDGEVQKLLTLFGVPYTGSDALGSYLAMHKLLAKARAKDAGLLTADCHYIERAEDSALAVRDVIRTFHQPVVVKPVGWGSSVGVSIVSGYDAVLKAVDALFGEGAPSVLVEEYLKGREATVGVVEGLRGETLYGLPAIEIIPSDEFFTYEAKYSGKSREICPGAFSKAEKEQLQHAAKAMHRTLGLRHYSRSDFIVTPRGVYYLETNTLPGLTAESLVPKALAAVGVRLSDFLDHLVSLAIA